MNITVGLYDDEQSKTFDYFKETISNIGENSVQIKDITNNLRECDIYCISIRANGALAVIEKIRKKLENVSIVVCCDDDPGIMRQLFDLDVKAVCQYGHDNQRLADELKKTIKRKEISDGLKAKLDRLEGIKNGSTGKPSRLFVTSDLP